MKVSDERLERLIHLSREAVAHGDPSHEQFNPRAMLVNEVGREHLSMLEELQRYRQAATAGVEEAAERLSDKLASLFSDEQCREHHIDTIRKFLTALLAERDAVLSECREVAAYVANTLGQIPTKYRSTAMRIIDRIDALTKGGGDGK